jgi:hypothetical protein
VHSIRSATDVVGRVISGLKDRVGSASRRVASASATVGYIGLPHCTIVVAVAPCRSRAIVNRKTCCMPLVP